jgi:hypothetical protein
MEILFYDKDKPYYEFTNFYRGNPIMSALPSEIKYDSSGVSITEFSYSEVKE